MGYEMDGVDAIPTGNADADVEVPNGDDAPPGFAAAAGHYEYGG